MKSVNMILKVLYVVLIFKAIIVYSQDEEVIDVVVESDAPEDKTVKVQDNHSENQPNIVFTKDGPISGIQSKTPDNKVTNIYYGIPYAKPPVGSLRFQPPQKNEPFSSTFLAVRPGPICYQQFTPSMKTSPLVKLLPRPWSEDCLTLNVWVPSPKPVNADVVVFIHGGAYLFGSSMMFVDGTSLASENIIVVSMNYRLGVFGFFTLGISEAPGNVGLMDQQLALEWVNLNIAAFGGNPNSVTIMGMSAGSASVGFHLLSPASSGLFHRAVMMSGVPTSPWAIRDLEESVEHAKTFLKSVGCPPDDASEALDCIRSKHMEEVGEVTRPGSLLTLEHFYPTVDGQFIVEHPSISASTGRFNPSDVMIGSAIDEGASFMFDNNQGMFKTQDGRLPRADFMEFVRNSRPGLSELQVEVLNVAYTDWNKPDDPIMLRDAAKNLYTDVLFTCHINEFAEDLAKAGLSVYRYVYTPVLSVAKAMRASPSWLGALHGSDQLPVLGPARILQTLTGTDSETAKRMLLHTTNFVRNGNPNLPKDLYIQEPAWPKYSLRNREYILFGWNSSIQSKTRSRQCATILKIIPMLEGR